MTYLRCAALLALVASSFDATAATIVVNTVGPSASGCTLEDAIFAANQNLAVGACPAGQAAPVADTIAFAIPPFDGSVATVHSTPELPSITERVLIDGLTQPGSSCTGGFPTLRVAITGPSDSFGLVLNASDITVRGVAIYGFGGQMVIFRERNVVQCNVIGMDASGSTTGTGGSAAHSTGLTISRGIDHVIGTDGDGVNDAAEGNWIAGNDRQIRMLGVLDNFSAGNRISGNRIGTNAAGTGAPAGSMQHLGIEIKESVRGTLIGSDGDGVSDALEGNVIAFNSAEGSEDGAGILVRSFGNDSVDSRENTIRGNSILANVPLDIDLAVVNEEGISESNDPLDADTGANQFQNRPAITSATRVGTSLRITGALDSAPSQDFEIELFGNAACNVAGFGPGEQALGTTAVTTNASGHASFDVLLPAATTPGYVTALATDSDGNTSEFSSCVAAALFTDGFEG